MNSAGKFFNKVKDRVEAATYSNPLYRRLLEKGPMPEGLRLSITDPWPGNAEAGDDMIAAPLTLFDDKRTVSRSERRALAAHIWLRDLRAVGTPKARQKSVDLIEAWLDGHDEWQAESWSSDVLGERLTHWIAFYDFYAPAANDALRERLLGSMVRQLRHLLHAFPAMPVGAHGLSAIKGLVYGGLALIDGEKALGLALELLKRLLSAELLPDGGVVSRNPQEILQILKSLIDIRLALREAQYEIPDELSDAIAKLVPALKLFRHGDGGLALFNGSTENTRLLVDAVLTLSEAKGRVLRRLPLSCYERITAGRSLLLADVGGVPPAPYDRVAHAGIGSFEFSVGRERIFVNCGAGPEQEGAWRAAMAATAAHNAMIVEDCNACEVMAEGGLKDSDLQLFTQRYEQDKNHLLEIGHDGYRRNHKVRYRRTLCLTEDGRHLSGEERWRAESAKKIVVRWHLHPSVEAALLTGGESALLKTPSGSGWRLQVDGGSLSIDTSLYCGGGVPRKTIQLCATVQIRRGESQIKWDLQQENKKKKEE